MSRPARCCLVLLAVCMLSDAVHAEPVYSKSRRFRIPFQFDSAELKRLGTKEVQLFVSRDGGDRWKLVEGVSPDTGKFTFEAPEDGVYWFSVKTVAASGLIYPAGPHQAGLNVLVDSTPPQLDLNLEEVEAGRVKLSWIVQDENLDMNSLKLEFREASTDVWSVVAVRTQAQGQTTWTMTAGGQIQVRGEVADLTGNVTQASAECQLAAPIPRNDKPDYGKPVANESMNIPQVSSTEFPKATSLTPRMTSTQSGGESLVVKGASTSSPNPVEGPSPVAVDVSKSSKEPIHKVNSTTFRIGYSLDGIGPSGVKQVNLYITEDNGKKWFHYGEDPDRTSPMEVTVPADGEYGLAFRVTNGLGRVEIPPQPNDPPEVRVAVDRTPPVVKLMPLEHGQELDSNKVIISWTAHDQDLADEPVALFYSVAATGPWEVIQGQQPNNGRFSWTVPPTLEQPFYVRLDVKDNSGNVTRVYAEKPFLVDRAQPRARITEVSSLNSSAQ
ncbi:hypothetical protein SH661x_000312 [Planctomicrobium sp. SH661]|uniref:hypothetical protein n=1 Tax=Planctomicrobium sp. SH661 TaxID=3448124 RepID=UPI003F5B1A12